MKFLPVRVDNINLLQDFISELGQEVKSFRYFQKRELNVIMKHLVTLLYIDGDKTIGYGHLEKEGDNVWLGICVRERYQGKGYGRELMLELIEEARLKGINKIMLTVDKMNSKAVTLYEKMGFNKVNDGELYYTMEIELKGKHAFIL